MQIVSLGRGVIQVHDLLTEDEADQAHERLKTNISHYPEVFGFGRLGGIAKCVFIHLNPDTSIEQINRIISEVRRILNT